LISVGSIFGLCDDISTVIKSTVSYSAQIDAGSERRMCWYRRYSDVTSRSR
jgi:hypothetical protein